MIATEAPIKLTRNEGLKEANPLLAGTIPQTLADAAAERFSDDDYEFLKFHGIYQQDDRDRRKTGKHYILKVRTKFPGGVLAAPQYLACDDLAGRFGNNTLRITTRQDFQFHGIVKSNLRQTMRGLNEALMSTVAACGDVERNVMAPPTPATATAPAHRPRKLPRRGLSDDHHLEAPPRVVQTSCARPRRVPALSPVHRPTQARPPGCRDRYRRPESVLKTAANRPTGTRRLSAIARCDQLSGPYGVSRSIEAPSGFRTLVGGN